MENIAKLEKYENANKNMMYCVFVRPQSWVPVALQYLATCGFKSRYQLLAKMSFLSLSISFFKRPTLYLYRVDNNTSAKYFQHLEKRVYSTSIGF